MKEIQLGEGVQQPSYFRIEGTYKEDVEALTTLWGSVQIVFKVGNSRLE